MFIQLDNKIYSILIKQLFVSEDVANQQRFRITDSILKMFDSDDIGFTNLIYGDDRDLVNLVLLLLFEQ